MHDGVMCSLQTVTQLSRVIGKKLSACALVATGMGSGIAALPLNRLAGTKLKEFREELELEQKEFASRLSEVLGMEVKAPAYSNYEAGRRPVPAALLLAASKLTETPIFVDDSVAFAFGASVANQAAEIAKQAMAGQLEELERRVDRLSNEKQ